MKTILTILLVIITLNCNAQLNKHKQKSIDYNVVIIPATILVTTAFTVDYLARSGNANSYQLDQVGITGLAVSIMSYIVIDAIKSNPPRKAYKKRIRKLSRL